MSKDQFLDWTNRDVMLAFSVGQMLEWGLFDAEFSTFGLSFWKDNTQNYLISLHEKKVYAYFMSGENIDQYPLPCLVSRKFYTGASGCDEEIDRDIKLEMAKKLRVAYPREAYEKFVAFAQVYEDDQALDLLEDLQEKIWGKYIEADLQLFERLVERARRAKHLRRESYMALKKWVAKEFAQLDNESKARDIFQKTLYSLGYIDKHGKKQWFYSADSISAYKRYLNLQQEHVLCSDVLAKTYWYNYQYRLLHVRHDLKDFLIGLMDEDYFAYVAAIDHLPSAVPKQDYLVLCHELKKDIPEWQVALDYYRIVWGI